MKNKAPAFQFYVRDWLSAPDLRMASCSTKGIWIDLLCYMWESRDRGELEGTKETFLKLTGASEKEFDLFHSEAKRLGFCDICVTNNGSITIKNRRMSREEKTRKQNRERQARWRDKGNDKNEQSANNAHVTQPTNAKVTPPSSSSSSSSNIKKKVIKKKFGELENVKLADIEYEKLVNRFGSQEAHDRIDRLSLYIKSRGDKYKDHYATILSWARKDKEDEKKSGPVARTQAQKSVQDRSALLRSMREEDQKNGNRQIAGNTKRIGQT